LLRSVGFAAREFASAGDALDLGASSGVDCFIVDIRMPGMSGLDFQAHLRNAGNRAPVIFITGHADIPMTVQAMKGGAYDFLTKPFRNQDMLDAVSGAFALNSTRREGEVKTRQTLARFQTLSVREREVMCLVTAGMMNKQAAARIDIAISTVKTHRMQIMKKMGARSLAELVRMAEMLQLRPSSKLPALESARSEPE
jgi:FixJ family two-component response regulator